MTPPNPAALLEFTRAFYRATEFSTVTTFREVSQTGRVAGADQILEQATNDAKQLIVDGDQFFGGPDEFLQAVGGVEGFGALMAAKKMETHIVAVDSASLVFAHSILDDVAQRFLKCTLLACPLDREPYTDRKTSPLAEFKQTSYGDIQLLKAQTYLKELEKESLLKKSDILWAICRPPTDFSPMDDYTFDLNRLRRLDELRHEVVHGYAQVTLPNLEEELWYMQKTAFCYLALVNQRYDLRVLTPDQIDDLDEQDL